VSRQTFQRRPDICRQGVGAARPGMRGFGAKNGTEHEREAQLGEVKGTGSRDLGATIRRFCLSDASFGSTRIFTAAFEVQLANAGNAG